MLDSNLTTPFVLTKKQLCNFQKKIITSPTHSYSGTPCQEWTGSKNKKGYGTFRVNGKLQLAHRVAWMIVYGEPDKPCVLHHCDYPPCCEKLHLFTGTNQDNMDDKMSKGRGNHTRGERHGRAKLEEPDIPEIFRLSSHGMTQEELALVFVVSRVQIGKVLRRKNWVHVKIPAAS